MGLNRRDWIQNSILATSSFLLPQLPVIQDFDRLDNEFLRLHWNENPFGPSPKVVDSVKAAVDKTNLYWDETIETLRKKLARLHSLKADQFLITSGSTEILALLGQWVGMEKGEIISGAQSFPTINMFGKRCGASTKYVSMNRYLLDLQQMSDNINDKTKLIFVCNPNNPTSTEIPTDQLKQFCRAIPQDILICIDEAYIEFSNGGTTSSMLELVDELPNLLICRTFSKAYGLAGFRLGYAISNKANIAALSYRYPALGMAPGLLPVTAGNTAIDDQTFVDHVVKETNAAKAIVYGAFDKWGVTYAESSTNFIYARDDRFVRNLIAQLKNRDILITKWPSMKGHIRISAGKKEWMQKLVSEMDSLRI